MHMTHTQLQQRNTRRPKKHTRRRKDLEQCPQKSGVCLKVYLMTPRKPNSAVRKVAWVMFSNYYRVVSYIRGKGHTLQKHSKGLHAGGRTQDLPGVRYKMIRGRGDFSRLPDRRKRRSFYATPLPAADTARGPYHKAHRFW